jgi:hypothetical protein
VASEVVPRRCGTGIRRAVTLRPRPEHDESTTRQEQHP